MRDITVIVPVLRSSDQKTLKRALDSVVECQKFYSDGKLNVMIVSEKSENVQTGYILDGVECKTIVNKSGKYDYCSQINYGVKHVNTEYFSILEYDDYYNKKWFNMFTNYLNTNEDVSVFLPINVLHNVKTDEREFVNDIIWSSGFANSIGYIDFDCLQSTASFNLTGGIFKTSDWLGYKPSIAVAFNYEYLLRATDKGQKVFVIPKEGYHHELFKDGSLSEYYINNISDEDNAKWFDLAKSEYTFDEDRNQGIDDIKRKSDEK